MMKKVKKNGNTILKIHFFFPSTLLVKKNTAINENINTSPKIINKPMIIPFTNAAPTPLASAEPKDIYQ